MNILFSKVGIFNYIITITVLHLIVRIGLLHKVFHRFRSLSIHPQYSNLPIRSKLLQRNQSTSSSVWTTVWYSVICSVFCQQAFFANGQPVTIYQMMMMVWKSKVDDFSCSMMKRLANQRIYDTYVGTRHIVWSIYQRRSKEFSIMFVMFGNLFWG